jgi:hypothetical protein
MVKQFLGALLLAALCGTGAFAQTEADFEVELTAGGQGAVVVKYTGNAAQVRFPAEIQGMPVREIGSGDSVVVGPGVTGIVIPEGVTEIGSNAFSGAAVTSVTLPKRLRSIGGSAFAGAKLSSITIPGGVTKIGNRAFADCENLKTVTISEGVTSIGDLAFYGCSALTTVTFLKGLQSIGNGAFLGCALTAVTFPEGLQVIGDNAFYNCFALTAVTFPEGLQVIGDNAFYGCSALTAVTLPASLQSIGYRAFYGCSALTTVTVPDTTRITGFTEYFGKRVDSIDDAQVFYNCPKLSLASQAAIRKLSEIAKTNREREAAARLAEAAARLAEAAARKAEAADRLAEAADRKAEAAARLAEAERIREEEAKAEEARAAEAARIQERLQQDADRRGRRNRQDMKIILGVRTALDLSINKPSDDYFSGNVTEEDVSLIQTPVFSGFFGLNSTSKIMGFRIEASFFLNNGLNLRHNWNSREYSWNTFDVAALYNFGFAGSRYLFGIFAGPYGSMPVGKMKNGGSQEIDKPILGIMSSWGLLIGLKAGRKLGPGYLALDGRYFYDLNETKVDGEKFVRRSGILVGLGYEFWL